MRIAICDDDKVFLLKLKQYLENYYKNIDVMIETFNLGEEFIKRSENSNYNYDIIFLDIEMGHIDGIEAAKRIRKNNEDIIIIFLTSHVEFATDGYEVDAFRFLIKPIQESKLRVTLCDIQKKLDINKKILIKDRDRDFLLRYSDIILVEAQNVNIRICTINDEFTIRKTLREFEKEISGLMFFKCHRSYIVNLEFVVDYDNKTITMENNERVLISRNKISEFKTAMMTYIRKCGR